MSRLQDIPRARPTPEVNIKVTPAGTPISLPWFDPDGGPATASFRYHDYDADPNDPPIVTEDFTRQGLELTFEAKISPNLPYNDIRWDMGDGTVLSGKTVEHTYKFASADSFVTCAVTFADGRTTYAGRRLYLEA